ncbi:MAG: hypothetical protein HOI70_08280, partial [Opitutae bacterium]|nr:hypothetical protein [Opitutae bacterium]
YVSDSNGYWRYRRLWDVLQKSQDSCLQVLTHPVWWQEKPMPPRQRIFRSVYGRAKATIKLSDIGIESSKRINQSGKSNALQIFKASCPNEFELFDFLWNCGHLQTLFVELWRLHEAQSKHFCKAEFFKTWGISGNDVNVFFKTEGLMLEGKQLLKSVFDQPFSNLPDFDSFEYKHWKDKLNQINRGFTSASSDVLENGCLFLCRVISKFAEWGKLQSWNYDGLAELSYIGFPNIEFPEGKTNSEIVEPKINFHGSYKSKWESLKKSYQSNVKSDK